MAGNLEFIKNVNGSSNVSNVDVTNVFTDKYDVYKIVTNITTDASFHPVDMRLFDSGGTIIDQAEYDYAFLELRSSTTYGVGKNTGQTEIQRPMRTGDGAAAAGNNVVYFFNPYDSSSYTFLKYQVSAWSSGTPQLGGQKGIAVHTSAETITGFRYFVTSDNITSHSISVFGVK
jgi:hypothetical protein|tara:strand:- start:251 stop:772 length:522 start_codon:yes stop_codon:yes gene_type:complete